MKRIIITLLFAMIVFSSCTVIIPSQANLSDQTMLLAKNKNIKANYTLKSEIPDGYISFVHVQKNGSETSYSNTHKYASETVFKKIWSSYFSNKFNEYSDDKMNINVTLKELKLKEQSATSIGATMITGNEKKNVNAIATIYVNIEYHGKKYEKKFNVTASDYNESQMGKYFTYHQTNPTQQKSKLLEGCLNKTIIQFENYLRSIMINDQQ